MMNIMSNISIQDLGRPVLPTGGATVSEPPGPGVIVGNTPGAGVLSLPNDEKDEKENNKRNNRNTRARWTKEVNKTVMRCFYQSDPTKRGYRKRMMTIWREIGLFDVTEQRLADQTRAIRTNGWLSVVELEEIEREIKDGKQKQDGEDTQGLHEAQGASEESIDREDLVAEVHDDNFHNRLQVQGISEEKILLIEEIIEQMKSDEAPPNLRNVERKRLKSKVDEVNEVLKYIPTEYITATNKLLKAAGCVVARKLGIKKKTVKPTEDARWKKRIKTKINMLRKDLSRLDRWCKKELHNSGIKEELEKKYNVKSKGMNVVIEELKQRIVATSAKLTRYEARTEQYIQNRMFQTNQTKLFQRLEKEDKSDDIRPESEDSVKFWSGIWSQPVVHNDEAQWLRKVEEKLRGLRKQEDILITTGKLKKQLQKMKNWKAPGPDGLQGYWIKRFTSCYERIALQLQLCLEIKEVPDWLSTGKTVLIIKDKEKGNDVTNYRPITCLPMMWKLLTGVLSDELYDHLESEELLPEEQKGCRRKSRGTKDQLLIDKMILRNCKRRLTGLGMAWIDYKKAYDMVPHSWLKKCMMMFGVADNMQKLLESSMEKWKTELTSGGQKLGTVRIKRGIFQGDSLSPLLFVLALIPISLVLREVKAGYNLGDSKGKVNHLLFMDDLKLYGQNEKQVDSLVNTVRIFSKDIGMEFGISKCAVLIMKRGVLSRSEGIQLPNDELIKNIEEGEGYKYLGILESDGFKNTEMKEKIRKEYLRRIKKILKSKLNSGNVVAAINSRAVAVIRYGAGLIKWTKDELRTIDRKTRKIMTMHRALHPQADIDRLYLPRSQGGRGMISAEDCVEMEVKSLEEYVIASNERMLKAVEGEQILRGGKTKKEILEIREKNFMEKPLHSQFSKKTKELRAKESWNWLKKGRLKKETEGMLMAAQDQALRTNSIRSKIDKQEVSPMCRLCGEREETISHVVAECKMLAQKQYRLWRHDRVGVVIHWVMCQRFGFPAGNNWYDHTPDRVLENEVVKILWDFSIQTDHKLDHNKPDIVILDKSKRECHIIDVACPFDTRVKEKELEKVEIYQDLKREIGRMWKCGKVLVIPIVIGALGTIGTNFKAWTKVIKMDSYVDLMQKACLLGTVKIIRKVLDT